MATNYPGPYDLRFFYTVGFSGGLSLLHTMKLNCDVAGTPAPGTPPDEVMITRKIASINPLDDMMNAVVDEFGTLLRALYNTANTSFARAELWRYTAESFESEFVTSYDIGLGGSSASGNTAAGQAIMTFRTIEGGVLKISPMETVVAVGNAVTLGSVTGGIAAIRDFVLSDANWILGRDTSYPFAGMTFNPGTNEALFKKRFRQLT